MHSGGRIISGRPSISIDSINPYFFSPIGIAFGASFAAVLGKFAGAAVVGVAEPQPEQPVELLLHAEVLSQHIRPANNRFKKSRTGVDRHESQGEPQPQAAFDAYLPKVGPQRLLQPLSQPLPQPLPLPLPHPVELWTRFVTVTGTISVVVHGTRTVCVQGTSFVTFRCTILVCSSLTIFTVVVGTHLVTCSETIRVTVVGICLTTSSETFRVTVRGIRLVSTVGTFFVTV